MNASLHNFNLRQMRTEGPFSMMQILYSTSSALTDAALGERPFGFLSKPRFTYDTFYKICEKV